MAAMTGRINLASILRSQALKRSMHSAGDLTAGNTSPVLPIRKGGRQSVSGIVATVFGSTGFVGRYVVSDLGRIGSQVIVPYRSTDGNNARHLKLAGDLGQVVPMHFDMTEVSTVEKAVARSNVVINLLGSDYSTRNYSLHDANAKTAHRIAKAAKEAGVDRFIHVSSAGADVKSSSEYLAAKAESEHIVRGFFPDATILRPNHIFGDEDRFVNRFGNMLNWWPCVPLVNGGQTLVQPLWVQDLSAAIVSALNRPETAGKTYELAGPDVMTINYVIENIAKHIQRPLTTLDVPEPLLKVLGFGFEQMLAYRLRWLWSRDYVEQLKIDRVIKPNASTLTIEDLGVTPSPFIPTALGILRRHAGARKIDLDEMGVTASHSVYSAQEKHGTRL